MFGSASALTFAIILAAPNGVGNLRLEPSVLDTPIASDLAHLENRLLATKSSPQRVDDAGKEMVRLATGDFRDDILAAATNASKSACSRHLMTFSGRARAVVFSDEFWRTLDKGKTYKAIRRNAGPKDDADLEFTEFHGLYLEEFAEAWDMRSKGNAITTQCREYGVNDVAACLKVILVASVAPSACKIDLADHMFVYLPQPEPDQAD